MRTRNLWIGLLLLLVSPSGQPAMAAGPQDDPVLFSFATVGDSSADPETADITAQDRIWLQNTKVLARVVREVQSRKPGAFVFNGDMIMGYSADTNMLNRQYAYWRGMMAGLMESGTYLLPVPGNHEVQVKDKDAAGKVRKTAIVSGEIAWRANMGDLILDTNRWQQLMGEVPGAWNPTNAPAIGGADAIQTDQQQLSYSFDHKGIHFAVINTDAVGRDSRAPVAWLKQDFEQARVRGAKHFFVFGHKMAFTYAYSSAVPPKGFDVDSVNQNQFWDLMEEYDATYFCGHEHIYHSMQPRKAEGGRSWQVIVGSGGSPFEAAPGESTNPHDRMYAWAYVQIHQSGHVQMDVHALDETLGPTRVIEQIELKSK
ncbi:MAG TPA: metallophosphoesterase [Roseimicrobium sp.]|nr:metallophosphoesterase [Roseimicrobium sp.]